MSKTEQTALRLKLSSNKGDQKIMESKKEILNEKQDEKVSVLPKSESTRKRKASINLSQVEIKKRKEEEILDSNPVPKPLDSNLVPKPGPARRRKKKGSGWCKSRKLGPKSKSNLVQEKPPPPEVTTFKLSQNENQVHFCLDCEGCKSRNCDHTKHTRKLIEGRLDTHILNYAHGRFQNVETFFSKKCQLRLEDLAYDTGKSKF